MLARIAVLGVLSVAIAAAQQQQQQQPLPTAKERWRNYTRDAFYSPDLFFGSVIPAAFDHWNNRPSEYGQGWDAFGERTARRAAQFELQEALYHASSAALRTRTTYQRCNCSGYGRRIRHAISRTFVTPSGTSGRLIPNIPLFGATYGGAMIATNWYPDRLSAVRDGTRIAHYQVGASVGFNILQEFGPEVKRLLRRKKK